MLKRILTWAVLAPAPAAALAPLVERAWFDRFAGDAQDLEQWSVRACSRGYSSVICRIPGTEGDDETLAQQLSADLKGDVYALRFLEGAEVAWVYVGGTFVREDPRGPYAVASSFGCTLEGDAIRTSRSTRGLCVVEDAAPVDVDRIVRRHLGRVPVRTIPNKLGAIVYVDGGNASIWGPTLASELPGATVYSLVAGAAPGQLSVVVSRGEDAIGSLEIGGPRDPNYEPLDDIKGVADAGAVLRALDIPPDLLA